MTVCVPSQDKREYRFQAAASGATDDSDNNVWLEEPAVQDAATISPGPTAASPSVPDSTATTPSLCAVSGTRDDSDDSVAKMNSSNGPEALGIKHGDTETTDSAAVTQIAALRYRPCGSRGKWQGKAIGSNQWQDLAFIFVQRNFKSWFVNQCRERPNQQTKVPAGSASVGHAELDTDLNGNGGGGLTIHSSPPEVMFQQGNTDTCVFSGAASALQYVGDSRSAAALSEMITASAKYLDPMEQLEVVVCNQTAWDVEGISEATYDVLQPHPYPACIQIRCSDGQVNHSVTTVDQWIFDSNRQYALPLCKKSFDECAGEGATFVGCVRVFTFVPSVKLGKALAKKRKRHLSG